MPTGPGRVVICGGGVIGTSIAYFLSCGGIKTAVIERCEIACAASGKSGGFLALDWCDGTPLEALARRSFALHASLAEKLGGAWGYRRLETFGGVGSAIRNLSGHGCHELGWVSEGIALDRHLGSPKTTAQVHPEKFTNAMMRAAEANGAELRVGAVTGLVRARDGRVRGVDIGGETLEADAVVIAMGPWSVLAASWLRLPGVYGLKGHSLVFETGNRVPAESLFLEYEEANGGASSPEVFPRDDGTTYVCAISSEGPLPVDPADVSPDPGAIERLETMCRDMSPILRDAPIIARQACFRPVTRDGLPLIGIVADAEGVFVATGHSVWGILNAPATGEAMAELIVDGAARSVDLRPFDPRRMKPLAA
jgi:glycine/D-amino acid oxidase-like deaminating enzyme